MKKNFFIILTFIFCLTAKCQTLKIDSSTSKYTLQGIIKVDSLKKDFLYSRTREWVALQYKSANDVVQLADKETPKLILKGNFSTGIFMKEGWIGHTLVLDFKDGKIRYSYSDFTYNSSGSGELAFESNNMGAKKKIFKTTEDNIAASIESLNKYLLESAKKKDDW